MTKAVQAMKKVSTEVGSIMVVGVVTHRALFHFMCDLKAAQMNA